MCKTISRDRKSARKEPLTATALLAFMGEAMLSGIRVVSKPKFFLRDDNDVLTLNPSTVSRCHANQSETTLRRGKLYFCSFFSPFSQRRGHWPLARWLERSDLHTLRLIKTSLIFRFTQTRPSNTSAALAVVNRIDGRRVRCNPFVRTANVAIDSYCLKLN